MNGASLSSPEAPPLMTGRLALELATRGGAAVLGRDDIGSLEPGKCCDFAAYRLDHLGFAGGLVMSAIKRDRGIKDYGATLAGHGGIMDRIDSLCFSAPVFFHLIRFYFTE